MKILALEVSGVRVYREFRRVEFSSGLNVFVGPNRAGKTSLADALGAALYGVERARSSPLGKTDLRSWAQEGESNAAEFRTAVEVETGEERFRLERDLNAGRARLLVPEGDGWRLRTADVQAVAAAVKKITGIDRGDLFLATAYLRQGDLARIAEGNNLIRMGEILRGIVSGIPQADVSEILARLRSAQRDVKSEGGTGYRPVNPREYDRLVQERERVQQRISETEETCRIVLSLSERKAELEEEIPEDQRRLEEVHALLERWERKTRVDREAAAADVEADSLSRRLRRLREVREELKLAQDGLREMGDTEGLLEAVTGSLPKLRARREAAERRSAELRREVARLREERQALVEEVSGLEVFGNHAQAIEEQLPLWEEAVREKARAQRREGPAMAGFGAVPSWGKISLAFVLFLVVFGTPFIYRAVSGDLPLYLFAFFGLAFPVLLWAVLLLNRRLLSALRLGVASTEAGGTAIESGEAEPGEDPQESIATLFRTLGVEGAEGARAGLRKFRDRLPGLKSSEDLCRRAGEELEEAEGRLRALAGEIQGGLRRLGVDNEDALHKRNNRAQELLRRREDSTAREREILAEGSEQELAARLDEADRRRRDLRREAKEEGFDLLNPSAAEVEQWRREEVSLAERVESGRTEHIRIRARLEEKMGDGIVSVETLGEQLQEIDDRLNELDILYRAYGVAVETLEEAAQELEDSYLPRLQGAAQGHFRSVVGQDFGVDLTSGWPAVTVALPEHQVEPRNLSRGTADQLYLALRAACLELLGGEEPLPLILDDPFVHYDDASRRRALTWLRRMAARTQVIFLAAREEYADWAERTAGEREARVFRLGSQGMES
ncbi:MAG: AAA family ATPase [Nitrospinota bacterium]